MMQLNAYLNFDGTCAEAMRFYQQVLGGQLDLMTSGESPMADQLPPGSANRILHARLSFDGGTLYAADTMIGQPFDGMKGFWASLQCPPADVPRLFEALSAGGAKVVMPVQKTFWSDAFGMLVDRYGTPWMLNGESSNA